MKTPSILLLGSQEWPLSELESRLSGLQVHRVLRRHLAEAALDAMSFDVVVTTLEATPRRELTFASQALSLGSSVVLLLPDQVDIEGQIGELLENPGVDTLRIDSSAMMVASKIRRMLRQRHAERNVNGNLGFMRGEFVRAEQFQLSLLPPPSFADSHIVVRAAYKPGAILGGDLYDYKATVGGTVLGIVADVAGHGARAAMLTGLVKAAFHRFGTDPAAVPAELRCNLMAFQPDLIITMFAFAITLSDLTIHYCNAGHPEAFVKRHPHGLESLPSTGPLVAAMEGLTWTTRTAQLGCLDQLFVYTDGLTELGREDRNGMLAQRLPDLLRTTDLTAEGGLEKLVSHSMRSVGASSAEDDITLLALQIKQGAAEQNEHHPITET